MIRIGVTGTDTGVGKTLVSCALSAALARRGMRICAMKPIETGVTPGDPLRDGARLALAANDARPLAMTAPITFPHPSAPIVAARRAGSFIDLQLLDASVHEASIDHDVLLVEGAGGLLVPITEHLAFDALFARWSLDLVVVAANRLGVINHVRLTLAAARAADLRVRAVVLNQLAALAPDASVADNARVIADVEHVSIVELPWMADPNDLDALAAAVERSGLAELIAPTAVRTTAPPTAPNPVPTLSC
jgi:dethiobiotin synthetase